MWRNQGSQRGSNPPKVTWLRVAELEFKLRYVLCPQSLPRPKMGEQRDPQQGPYLESLWSEGWGSLDLKCQAKEFELDLLGSGEPLKVFKQGCWSGSLLRAHWRGRPRAVEEVSVLVFWKEDRPGQQEGCQHLYSQTAWAAPSWHFICIPSLPCPWCWLESALGIQSVHKSKHIRPRPQWKEKNDFTLWSSVYERSLEPTCPVF